VTHQSQFWDYEKHSFVKRFRAAWACAFKRIFIANRRVRANRFSRPWVRQVTHPLWRKLNVVTWSRDVIRAHYGDAPFDGAALRPQYVRCIDIHRERHSTPLSSPPESFCRSKRRVLLVQVMPDWLSDRCCSSVVRFPSSFSFVSSRLLLRVRPRERTYVYEQCNFNKGAFSKSQQTSAIAPPWFDSSSNSLSLYIPRLS